MRVLHASPSYAPDWHCGGPPRVLATYAKALRRMGHEVEALVPAEEPEKYRAERGVVMGVPVHYFKRYRSPLARWYWNYSPWEVGGWLRANLGRFDVVHLAQSRTLLNVLVHREARRAGVPYVLSSFGSLPRRSHWAKGAYDLAFTLPLVRDASLTLGQTEHEVDEYVRYGGPSEKARLLPLAIDVDEIPFAPRTGRFRRAMGLQEDDQVVLFLGRLHETKGIDVLLEGFVGVASAYPRAMLVIVGHDCGFGAQLKPLIKALGLEARVRIGGPIFGSERFEVYADADVFCLTPRIWEETSLASLEALACGTPIVTNIRADIPGLTDERMGKVLRSDDAGALSAALGSFLRGAESNTETQRARIRAFSEETFSGRKVGVLLEGLLNEAVAAQRRGEAVGRVQVRNVADH